MLTRSTYDPTTSMMSEETVEQYLPLKSCRICLKPGEIPIFGQDDKSEDVMKFGDIEIFYGDNHPQYLCHACLSLLQAAILFRRTAKKSDKILKQGGKSIKIGDSTILSEDQNYMLDDPNDTEIENDIKKEYLEYNNTSGSEYDLTMKYEPEPETTNKINSTVDTWMTMGNKNIDLRSLKENEDSVGSNDSLGNESFIKKEYLEYNNSSESEYEPKSENEAETENVTHSQENIDKEIEFKLLKIESNRENAEINNDLVMIIVSDKQKMEQTYYCIECNINFENKAEFEIHNTEKHPTIHPNQKKCDICHQLVHEKNYKLHIKQHRDKYKEKYYKNYRKIECEVCGKKINKLYLKYHMKMHGTAEEQAERYVVCTICNKTFSAHYFNDHMRRIHDKTSKPLQKTKGKNSLVHILRKCPICDKNVNEDIYKQHLAKHGGPTRQYICEKCGKVFKYPSAFKTHTLTHGSELKYQCQFCPYRGLHLGLLKIHVRTHTGDYNYKCSECPARFITKSNLTKHFQRHQGLCKFKCDTCKKGFYCKRDVEKHVQSVHLRLKNSICDICGKGFGHRDNMLSHQLQVHKRKKLTEKRGRVPSYLKDELMKC